MRYIMLLAAALTLAACSLGDVGGGEPTAEPLDPQPTQAVDGRETNAFYCNDAFSPTGPVVRVEPNDGFDGRCYKLRVGQTVTLTYENAPADVEGVRFLLHYWETMDPVVIADDFNPSDGWGLDAIVSADWEQAALYAWAESPSSEGGIHQSGRVSFLIEGASTASCQGIEAIGMGEGAPVTITPSQASGDGCYALPGTGTYTVAWDAPPGTTEATFYRRSPQMFRSDTIGVDRDPSDGFSVTFQLDGAMPPSQLWADGITDPTVSGSMIQGQVVGIYMAN